MREDQPKASNLVPASEPKIRSKGFAVPVSEWNARHPVLAVVIVSLLAVAINCYPIIFCGKSRQIQPVEAEPQGRAITGS